MIVIGKSKAALAFICDAEYSIGDLGHLSIYNNLGIKEDYIFGGEPIHEITELPETGEYILGAVVPETKRKIVSLFPKSYWTVIHKTATVSDSTEIGEGCMLGEGSTICAGTTFGNYVTLYCNASVNHDCKIGDYVTICPNVAVCGSVKIGEGTFVGAGSVIKNGITIGKNCTIGCGSVVVKDVPDGVTVYGNPARIH